MTYTEQDYFAADDAYEKALAGWENNLLPKSVFDEAEKKLAEVIAYLRANGSMPKTRHEILEESLDRLYPEAASKEVVEYQGKRFRRLFRPLKRGKGGGVVEWERSWSPLD